VFGGESDDLLPCYLPVIVPGEDISESRIAELARNNPERRDFVESDTYHQTAFLTHIHIQKSPLNLAQMIRP
jgi:hypothetical protein